MGAIAKRLGGGRAATTKRHPLLHWKCVSIRVDELNRSLHNVRAVLNRLDSYLSHDGCNLSEKYSRRPLYETSPSELFLLTPGFRPVHQQRKAH
jgi:hypothetical protein